MRGTKAISALFSMFLFSVSILGAQNNGAILYAHGNVTLNGQALGSSTSIFSGDRLDTADSSVVTINRSGSSVVVNPNSSVQYTQSSIQIMHGTARVSTLSGMSAQVGQLMITPQDGKAKFDVVQSDKGTAVTLREGSLQVRDGDSTVTLQPGTTRMFASGATSLAQNSTANIMPRDDIKSFDTVTQPPEIRVCSRVSLCFGRLDVSQSQPCRCR